MLLNHSPVILVYPFVKVCQVTLLTLKLESVPCLSRCPSYLEQKDGTFWVLNTVTAEMTALIIWPMGLR